MKKVKEPPLKKTAIHAANVAMARCWKPTPCKHLQAEGKCGLCRKETFHVTVNGREEKRHDILVKRASIEFVEICPVGRLI